MFVAFIFSRAGNVSHLWNNFTQKLEGGRQRAKCVTINAFVILNTRKCTPTISNKLVQYKSNKKIIKAAHDYMPLLCLSCSSQKNAQERRKNKKSYIGVKVAFLGEKCNNFEQIC